ncbi:MAG: hypothetical protein C4560_01485 [Nitrospiraceae bacterium]|nr:MAG: hypothetical protein C4560_01485 [Nitrospiraceae bacterium]
MGHHTSVKKYTEEDLFRMVRLWLPEENVPKRLRVKDTSDFFRVDYDDIVMLGGTPYLVRNNERERRFGVEDEPKFWVKRAVNLVTGRVKILKWTFREKFRGRVGNLVFDCVRSPLKEARILNIVQGRPDFMHGETVQDSAGHLLRIIDYIQGKTLPEIVRAMTPNHEDFFRDHYPGLLSEFISTVEAIRFLHDKGEKHGDIRRDHLIRDSETGRYRWIDFDYNYRHRASKFGYDLFGLGNVLIFITGGGDITVQALSMEAPEKLAGLSGEDVNIIFHNRVANLKKIYPYIPEFLNRILMHFAAGAKVYYESTGELLEDLKKARDMLPG